MRDVLTQIVVWLNSLANALGGLVLAPVALLPGWLSATLIAVVTGVLLLVVFKYTSSQKAIKGARDDINAHLLALKLFKESARVAVRAQGRILLGAFRLMVLAIVPMLVMAGPVLLILGQMSLWYQARPLRIGEEALVTVKLNDAGKSWPDVQMEPSPAVESVVGPVRIRSNREVCWSIKAREKGTHRLVFQVGGQPIGKELAVGEGFLRVSSQRPGWDWWEALLNPWEPPFAADSPVTSISIDYPTRSSWTSGTNWWVYYWFGVSTLAALCFRPLLKVQV